MDLTQLKYSGNAWDFCKKNKTFFIYMNYGMKLVNNIIQYWLMLNTLNLLSLESYQHPIGACVPFLLNSSYSQSESEEQCIPNPATGPCIFRMSQLSYS